MPAASFEILPPNLCRSAKINHSPSYLNRPPSDNKALRMPRNLILPTSLILLVATANPLLAQVGTTKSTPHQSLAEKTDFDRQIRPILSNTCFTCHGPDDANRKAKLRLD